MARFTDDAIVIRVQEWSETSQLVTLLTRGHGKVRGLAKGSKRLSPSSLQRFSGGFDLLTQGQAVTITRPSTELASLIEWDLREPWPHLRRRLAALQLSCYAADAVNALIADEDEHAGAYEAMAAFIVALRDESPQVTAAALLALQWSLLVECGYCPELNRDVVHDQPLPARASYAFDPIKGGLTTDAPAGSWKVRRQTVEALRLAASSASDGLAQADEDSLTRGNRLLCAYLRAILDKELPTMRFVQA
jgi:DNA repair protein RecO (recombination protein O)